MFISFGVIMNKDRQTEKQMNTPQNMISLEEVISR